MTDNDCLFCRIVDGELPADFVHQDDLVVAIRDINPKAPTHLLLMPRKHIVSAAELTEEDGPILGRLFAVAAQLARDAGQSVAHLHFHLLGGRSMSWPPG